MPTIVVVFQLLLLLLFDILISLQASVDANVLAHGAGGGILDPERGHSTAQTGMNMLPSNITREGDSTYTKHAVVSADTRYRLNTTSR